jgi:NAD(P)-dependent dehydrogenase (short-subunit alcohol dehydrogenase family)
MKNFTNKVAVITGAGSGIGQAVALALADEGARLALSDINRDSVQETVTIAQTRGAEARAYHLDVADREAIERHAEAVVADFGAVHLLINNAGVALQGSFAELSREDFEWLININFWGVVNGTRIFLPYLENAPQAHIVNISSVFGLVGVPGQSAYNAAKFGVRGFTECLRQELEMQNSPVSITSVHPGGVRTAITLNSRVGALRENAPSREEVDHEFQRLARTTPERAAQIILDAVRRNKRRVRVGPDAVILDWIQRLFPSGYQRLLVAMARRKDTLI